MSSGASNLANQSGTANSNIVDLGSTTPFSVTEIIAAQIVTTAASGSGAAANNKNSTVQLMHSADNATTNMVNIPTIAPLIIPEVSAVYAASTWNVSLPSNTARYVMAQSKTEANGGNANTGTQTLKILF